MKNFLFASILLLLRLPAYSQYNFYFGNIHSHTAYSDGNKDSTSTGATTPGSAYNYAKGSYHMDFLGVSEHNHYSSNNNPGMHLADYAKGLYQADTANRNGSFVCMYGMEWGVIANAGHVVTYGIPSLVGWETGNGGWGPSSNYDIYCNKYDFTSFWSIVNAYPNAFCTLAHPQDFDYNDLAGSQAYNVSADNAIVGVAIRSGVAFSTTTNYSDNPPTLYEPVYFSTLAKGYHLGPTADQDNHYTTFGRSNHIRTVVLATTLNRDSIIAGYKAMRFYASDDWNAEVNFTVNGNYMGSDFATASNSSISVLVNDPGNNSGNADPIGKIELYYGVPGSNMTPTILTSNTGSDELNFIHPTVAGSKYYYFAKITEADGDIIWTSPVWVTRNNIVVPVELSSFTGRQYNRQIKLEWTTAQENNVDRFEIERSVNGINFEATGEVASKYHTTNTSTAYDFTDLNPFKGNNFYRLKQVDQNGYSKYSDIIAVAFNKAAIRIVQIAPNPVINTVNITCVAEETLDIDCRIYNTDGREINSVSSRFIRGENKISVDASMISAGIYFVVISKPGERIAETKFIKQ